jgi:hypothetical protein
MKQEGYKGNIITVTYPKTLTGQTVCVIFKLKGDQHYLVSDEFPMTYKHMDMVEENLVNQVKNIIDMQEEAQNEGVVTEVTDNQTIDISTSSIVEDPAEATQCDSCQ